MFKEFKEFALRGNVVDMAVAFTVGAAFTTIVKSLVNDIIMPPIGVALGGVEFSDLFIVLKEGTLAPAPYATLAAAQKAGASTLNYGLFINTVLSFTIVAIAVFMLVKTMNKMRREKPEPEAEPTIKDCPRCFSSINIHATRCPNCTSDI
ncbi:MAG TPA: large conductance mechanosensitive channel protein MscL [Gammaproteobacteria bacterium]|nr:large conductance mechanosensitive channel protein MscL [Gammaproteobacteria bacterium]